MRRRIRSATLPLHRHALPQLAVDGALVAFAYYLAFQLRFEHGPTGYYSHLRERTIWWVLALSPLVLVVARVYQRRWRYAGQRDYEAVARGVVAIVLLTVAAVAVLRPGAAGAPCTPRAPPRSWCPIGVVVLFTVLALVLLVGVRALSRSFYERRPLAAFRGGRKGERTVLIAGAGEGGRLVLREIMRNRELGLVPVGFVDDDPVKRGLRIDGVRVRGNTEDELPRILDDAEPDEVIIAIPSAPGATRGRIVRECRARGIPGAHAADGLRAAADRRSARPPDARGPRRGRPRPRARAHGARERRLLSREPDRARHGRRRLDRRRAVPADRTRRASSDRAARPRRGQPLRDPA